MLVAGSFSGTLEIDEQEIKTSPEGVFTVFVFKWLETGGSASVDGTKSDKHGYVFRNRLTLVPPPLFGVLRLSLNNEKRKAGGGGKGGAISSDWWSL